MPTAAASGGGIALSGRHEQPPNCGVGRAHVFETERADDRFDEAEVGHG